jgi:hypothetical protein
VSPLALELRPVALHLEDNIPKKKKSKKNIKLKLEKLN